MKRAICVLSLLCLVAGNIQPHEHTRDLFATNFFRMFATQVQSQHGLIVNSPAALQKLLAIFYNITSTELSVGLTRDMAMRDFDFDLDTMAVVLLRRILPKIFEVEAINNVHLIAPQTVLNYFASDFSELRDEITFEHYFLIDGDVKISALFAASVRDYFNVYIMQKRQRSAAISLDIVTNLKYTAQLGPKFYTEDGLHQAYDSFRYRELLIFKQGVFPAKIVELPLISSERPMSLLLIMPHEPAYLKPLIEYLGTKLKSFKEISGSLKERYIAVRFPFRNVLTKINYANYVHQMSFLTLHKLFNAKVELQAVFENARPLGVHMRQFIQLINLHVTSNVRGAMPKDKYKPMCRNWNASNSFDASKSPFIFVISSSHVIYFMGLYDVVDGKKL